MKKIYIILTYTGTILSKIIHIYTKEEYTHSSISLDRELTRMYSFGRYNAYNPFWGGFIRERINERTFKRFYNTKTVIYSLEITDEQYERIESEIRAFILEKDLYRFNLLGLIAKAFNLRLRRRYRFYCSEFVKYLLDKAKIENNLPDVVEPEDFKKLPCLNLVYQGKLRNYSVNKSLY